MIVRHDVLDIQDDNELCYKLRSIFQWTFPVLVKQMYLIDEKEIQYTGMQTTLNNDYDYEFANVLATASIDVSNLAELYQKGITFQLVNENDPEKIYGIIRDYLQLSAEVLNERNINEEVARTNPHVINFIKDMQKLEALGNALYPMFGYGRVTNTKVDGFGAQRRLNSIRQGRINKKAQLTEEERRIQQRFHLDFRKELIPFVKESTAVWYRGK